MHRNDRPYHQNRHLKYLLFVDKCNIPRFLGFEHKSDQRQGHFQKLPEAVVVTRVSGWGWATNTLGYVTPLDANLFIISP
jgi:hypothetical protein